MTLKIEKISDPRSTNLRLTGRIRAEDLDELKLQMEGNGARVVLDLDGVTLVDVEVVRFLGACEAEGIELLHCSRYIREWILREQDRCI
jgi:anti-anti-sigma regulatory factor